MKDVYKSNMHHKIKEFTEAIEVEAEKRGLVFGNGPDTKAVRLQKPSPRQTNGQQGFVYLFRIAERQDTAA